MYVCIFSSIVSDQAQQNRLPHVMRTENRKDDEKIDLWNHFQFNHLMAVTMIFCIINRIGPEDSAVANQVLVAIYKSRLSHAKT